MTPIMTRHRVLARMARSVIASLHDRVAVAEREAEASWL